MRQRIRWSSIFLPTMLSLIAVGWLEAQRPRAMTLVDLLEVPTLPDAQMSPDGRVVAYVLGTPDWARNGVVTQLWRVDADGRNSRRLGPLEGVSGLAWSPDAGRVAVVSLSPGNGADQIHLVDAANGATRAVTRHATSVSSPAWSPDGAYIYFLAADEASPDERARLAARDDVYAFDENFRQQHLWRVSVASGRDERVTGGEYSIVEYALSRDGSRIVAHRAPDPLVASGWNADVWVLEPRPGGDGLQVTTNHLEESGARLSPDNSRLLFIAGANGRMEPFYNAKLFIVSATGGTPTLVAPSFPHEIVDAEWSGDGGSITVVANMGLHSELFRLPLDGAHPVQLTNGRHNVRFWRYQPRIDRHLVAFDEPTNPGDLWTLDAAAPPRRVTHVFDHLSRDFRLPRQERVAWRGADGVDVEGLLIYPLDYREGARYPLVVQSHGGPQSSDQYGFTTSMSYTQVLAARGYAVLRPNYRGSTGYGDDFMRDMVGAYFRNAHLDVLAGVDHLVALGVADSTRLIAMGWSAGGIMTNKLITVTTRFRAASSGAGAVNWISQHAQSDIREHRHFWFGGSPWQENAPIEAYWSNSPLKDIARAKTPTIIFVGERDARVPMPQSVELYRGLKSNGVPTRLYVAPREPHVWRELRHRLFKANAELEWFERHALQRAYMWESAPMRARTAPKPTP